MTGQPSPMRLLVSVSLILCCLGLVNCQRTTPAPTAKQQAAVQEPAPAQVTQPAVPEVLPRYLAQVKRELALASRRDGRYPGTAAGVAAMLVWQPGNSAPRPLQTLEATSDIAADKGIIWYAPPDASGTGAHLRYWAKGEEGVDLVVVIDPLDAAYDLAVRGSLPSAPPALASLQIQVGGDADKVLRELLLVTEAPDAARAAAAHYSIAALLEWVVTCREGVWPENETELCGMRLGRPGSVPGLEIFWNREAQKMYSRFTLPGRETWLLETQVMQPEQSGRWLAVTFAIEPVPEIPGHLWRIL